MFVKDPGAVLDYGVDWSARLQTGETITDSSWSVTGGLVIDDESHDATTATVWLSGGESGCIARATNRVTTTAGRTDARTIPVYVQDR